MPIEGIYPERVSFACNKKILAPSVQGAHSPVSNQSGDPLLRFAAVPSNLQKIYFGANWVDTVKKSMDINKSKALVEEIDFTAYCNRIFTNSRIVQTSNQRIYDMIMAAGTGKRMLEDGEVTTYNFFEKPSNPKDALIGMERVIDAFVKYLHQAAMGAKSKERLIVFIGGPGSAKSTLVRMLKKGLEEYTKTPQSALYSLKWVNLPQDEASLSKIRSPKDREFFKKLGQEFSDPINGDPIYLLPEELRGGLKQEINSAAEKAGLGYDLPLEGEVSPASLWIRDRLMEIYDQDITKVLENHVHAKRMIISERMRVGIGTFSAGDEKTLDKTQLSGNANYIKIPDYDGDESHPLAFDYKAGEFFSSNRGLMETIEGLKIPEQFLYEFFGLAQERTVKPDKQPIVTLDTTAIIHANEDEYQLIKENPLLKAFPSRMIVFKTPYPTNPNNEEEIYKKDFLPIAKKQKFHVAPHALEIAALWATTTRLQEEKDGNLKFRLQKAKLYSGKQVKGYSPASVRKLREEGAKGNEGLSGVSPREMQTLLPMALTHSKAEQHKVIDGSLILEIIKEKLQTTDFFNISDEEQKTYLNLLELTQGELDTRYKEDVTEALAGDESRLKGIFQNYLANVRAYCGHTEVEDPITGNSNPPNEKLMESIELKMGIDGGKKHEFRHELMSKIGTLLSDHKEFNWDTDDQLRNAIVQHVYEASKDTSSLASLSNSKSGTREREDLDTLIRRLIEKGYNELSARNAIARVRALQNR